MGNALLFGRHGLEAALEVRHLSGEARMITSSRLPGRNQLLFKRILHALSFGRLGLKATLEVRHLFRKHGVANRPFALLVDYGLSCSGVVGCHLFDGRAGLSVALLLVGPCVVHEGAPQGLEVVLLLAFERSSLLVESLLLLLLQSVLLLLERSLERLAHPLELGEQLSGVHRSWLSLGGRWRRRLPCNRPVLVLSGSRV